MHRHVSHGFLHLATRLMNLAGELTQLCGSSGKLTQFAWTTGPVGNSSHTCNLQMCHFVVPRFGTSYCAMY